MSRPLGPPAAGAPSSVEDVLELVRLDRQNNAGPIDFRHTVARLSDWGCDPL